MSMRKTHKFTNSLHVSRDVGWGVRSMVNGEVLWTLSDEVDRGVVDIRSAVEVSLKDEYENKNS